MAISPKQTATVFFLLLLSLIALNIPIRAAGLQDPIFYDVLSKSFRFTPEMGIFRSSGLGLTNMEGRAVIAPVYTETEGALYDLKLSFDGADFYGNYTPILSGYETNTRQKAAGAASAKFISTKNSLILMPKPSSVLAGSGLSVQSFTIDFWLYPYRTGEGSQTVFEFKGRNGSDPTDPRTYGITISLEKNTLTYTLENFFRDKNTNLHSFVLKERRPVNPEEWERHTFVLDASAPALRIYRGGVEQQAEPLTANRSTEGAPLFPTDNIASSKRRFPIQIGKNALFSLDELSISGDIRTNFTENRRDVRFLETEVFTLSSNSSYMHRMGLSGVFPKESGVRLAYRFSTNYFFPEDTEIPWVYINPMQAVFPPSRSLGKYFQWRFEYTPPAAGTESMQLYALSLDYRENSAPAALNLELSAESRGSLSLSWNSLPDASIQSYEIYYGTKPGVYFGKASLSPASPIVVPAEGQAESRPMNYMLEGLEDETAYYIVIRARDRFGKLGPPSPEIYARPSALKAPPHYSIGY